MKTKLEKAKDWDRIFEHLKSMETRYNSPSLIEQIGKVCGKTMLNIFILLTIISISIITIISIISIAYVMVESYQLIIIIVITIFIMKLIKFIGQKQQ